MKIAAFMLILFGFNSQAQTGQGVDNGTGGESTYQILQHILAAQSNCPEEIRNKARKILELSAIEKSEINSRIAVEVQALVDECRQ